MRAIEISTFGKPTEVLKPVDIPELPAPVRDRVLLPLYSNTWRERIVVPARGLSRFLPKLT
jgi:hypothetical protein